MYFHQDPSGQKIDLPVGKVVCVGRNYLAHIQELNNPLPDEAVLFIKPSTALCSMAKPMVRPKNQGSCHHEIELALLIDIPLSGASVHQAKSAICGVGLALDLTLRDVQDKLKTKGLPWERAKSFDYSCPVTGFVPSAQINLEKDIEFYLSVNGAIRQQGNSHNMLRNMSALVMEISQSFTLLPGDIVLTGTPEGVGPLMSGDQLTVQLIGHLSLHTYVV